MNHSLRLAFDVCFAACLLMIACALQFWGSSEIRANFGELYFLIFVAAVWLFLARGIFPWLGLNVHDDVAERGNLASLVAICGATISAALIYAGGSIGEGPSYL